MGRKTSSSRIGRFWVPAASTRRKLADPILEERAQQLLKVLVQRYIREGQPTGSRTLTRESGLNLSPATVRNIMADLEEAGYVRAPHTSAGRVPTDLGYRFFVDSLLTVNPLSEWEIEQLRIHLDRGGDMDGLIDSASNLLSGLTRLAGVVTVPRRHSGSVRQLGFLPLSERRVLAILVVNEQEVQNRVLQTDRDYSGSELEHISNYLNAEFVGKDIEQIRGALLDAMNRDRKEMTELMSLAIEVAQRLFTRSEDEDDDYVMAGETNLMTFAELSNIEKLKQLFEAFNHKRDIIHLLDRCLTADGVQIFIGQESGYEVFDGVSLITSRYQTDDEVLGVLGVIGPTRIPYDRIIPIVDVTAKLLGNALNPHH
ncbi:MAG TPA: heat-inducible transcriptional repressor HrcA [Nitrococcus sp.]|nr:heat-inducible transcriptional repressor HrcA [Nitrococcus sp.]